MFIPGAIVAADGAGLGAGVIPGVGAIVGAGDVFAGAGAGVRFFIGAGVAIGIPGMGAIVGCAATPGDAVRAIENAIEATAKRTAGKGTSGMTAGAYYAP